MDSVWSARGDSEIISAPGALPVFVKVGSDTAGVVRVRVVPRGEVGSDAPVRGVDIKGSGEGWEDGGVLVPAANL